MKKKQQVRTSEQGVRIVTKPKYDVCQLHNSVGDLFAKINKLPDAAAVRKQRRRSQPLDQLSTPF